MKKMCIYHLEKRNDIFYLFLFEKGWMDIICKMQCLETTPVVNLFRKLNVKKDNLIKIDGTLFDWVNGENKCSFINILIVKVLKTSFIERGTVV